MTHTYTLQHVICCVKFLLTVIIISVFTIPTSGQLLIQTTIEELIETAQQNSSSALLARTRLENQYWRNVSFDAGFKPQFELNAELPSLNRSINSIPLPNGEEAFVNRSFMTNQIGLQVTQIIPKTGGFFSLSSSLRRLDLFQTSSQDKSTSYLSAPLSIGFNQPLFQFNQFKWNKEIIDLEYQRAEKRFTEEFEMIAVEVVNRYFDLYLTDLRLITSRDNQQYLDSLANTAVRRFELGRIGETEMLQVQLSARNADALVTTLEQDQQNKTELLRDYLGIQEEVRFELGDPATIEAYLVDESQALDLARANRSIMKDFEIRLKNANMDLEQARNANQPELNITGSFGLTQSSPTFSGAFSGLQDQESVQIGITIPIADWGRSKAQREIAQSSLALEELLVREDRINFEREVALTVNQISLVRDRLILAREALTIADKRQDISKKRYELGKQDATNLNIAIQEYATAEQSYYQTLWEMWQIHFQLRLLTLYDFIERAPLSRPIPDKLK